MRKVVLFLLLICAQTAGAQTLVGLKLGPTFSNFKTSPDSGGTSTLVGYGGAFFWQTHGNSPVGLQLEIASLTKGAKFTDNANVGNSAKLKIVYFEIPANLLLRAGPHLYAFGGPAVGVEMSCMVVTQQSAVTVSNGCDNQSGRIFARRKIDFSAMGGAGYKYALGKKNPRYIMLEGRYEMGFTNIDKEPGDGSLKNRAWGIYLGYGTPIVSRKK